MFSKGKNFHWPTTYALSPLVIFEKPSQWFGILGCVRWRSYTCGSTEYGWSGRVWETNENWGDWRKTKRSDKNQFITFGTGKCYFSINWWKRTYSLSVSNPNSFHFYAWAFLDRSLYFSWPPTLTSIWNTLMIRIHGLISFLGTLNWPVYYKIHWVVMPKQ